MSADDWWYPWFILAFRRDTRHCTMAEQGAYRCLIDEYMLTREPLPNNDVALARILGIPTTEWEYLAPVVRKFFRARNDKLLHKRCEQELRSQNARNKANSERGKKAALVRWSKVNGLDAKRMLAPNTVQYNNLKPLSEYAAAKESGEGENVALTEFRRRQERWRK